MSDNDTILKAGRAMIKVPTKAGARPRASKVWIIGISPALTFEAGPEAAGYMLGNNTLLFNNNNESKVTSGTMARLVVNEIVHPKHHKERITLVDE